MNRDCAPSPAATGTGEGAGASTTGARPAASPAEVSVAAADAAKGIVDTEVPQDDATAREGTRGGDDHAHAGVAMEVDHTGQV